MLRQLLKSYFTIPCGLLLILSSSCYWYKPIHIPYDQPKRMAPPPPIDKKIAAPLSKSEYMQKTYEEMKNTLSEADVKLIEDSIKVLFPNHITYNKSAITPSSNYQEPLVKFAALLKKYYKTEILITGHTDSTGNKLRNKQISKDRAENIKMFVISKHINRTRLESLGLGDLAPIDSNETEDGRMRNRRVEFVVLYRE